MHNTLAESILIWSKENMSKKIDEKDQEQTELQNQTELNRQSKTRIKDLKNQIKEFLFLKYLTD
jgi:transposase